MSRGSRIGAGDGIGSQVGEGEADLLSAASEGQERISSLPRRDCGVLLQLGSPPKAQSKKIAADVMIRGKLKDLNTSLAQQISISPYFKSITQCLIGLPAEPELPF